MHRRVACASICTSRKNSMDTTKNEACPLCGQDGGRLVWRGRDWRLVHASEPGNAPFPAFYRLICNRHVAEWSDLPPDERTQAMEAVTLVERVLREELQPTKINLATLGNVVPHLHWHVISRFAWDSHFPNPVWGAAERPSPAEAVQQVLQQLPALEQRLARELEQHFGAP